ncbi:E3 ISG15--protein ligase Herc6 [Musca vetustissima]|uniref:E3 ISG15--protein ligase Herc6 n=1 Tax=Musca vetustissima TaxID=27455 RepID=UPI002AB72B6E|nr:E3 ISG15--protein ligase Herc6 [Musca vetustissima]
MEGGSGKLACNYNGDHLATADIKHSGKQWLACGSNHFGQLDILENERLIRYMKKIALEGSIRCLTSSWSYVAAINGCSMQIWGFINCQTKNIKNITVDNTIKTLACCDRYCLLLLNTGTVFKYNVQCLDDNLEEIKFQINESHKPKRLSIFGSSATSSSNSVLKIENIACGNTIMVAIGMSNEVFTGTTEVHRFPKHVRTKQLVCGFEHALLLTHNGDIYTWGNGLRGQLGLDSIGVKIKPILLEAMAGIKIICITASGWHSAAISTFGDLYTWGFNSNGQLGLRIYKNDTIKEPSIYMVPQLIELTDLNCCEQKTEPCIPIKVTGGARHTIVLMNCGAVFSVGWNAYGQLGLKNNRMYIDKFTRILKIENCIDDVEIVCGSWNTWITMHTDSKYVHYKN